MLSKSRNLHKMTMVRVMFKWSLHIQQKSQPAQFCPQSFRPHWFHCPKLDRLARLATTQEVTRRLGDVMNLFLFCGTDFFLKIKESTFRKSQFLLLYTIDMSIQFYTTFLWRQKDQDISKKSNNSLVAIAVVEKIWQKYLEKSNICITRRRCRFSR